MTIIEAIKSAKSGDPLGEAIRRKSWLPELFVLVSENSNTMEIGQHHDDMYEYVACIDDVLADDWEDLPSWP